MSMAHTQNDYVAAIDLGTTKVVTVVARKTPSGALQIVGLSTTVSNGIKKGMIQNIEDTTRAIELTVRDVKAKTGIDFNSVYVGIAGENIRSVKVRGGITIKSDDEEVRESDVQHLLSEMHHISMDVGESILHVLPLDYFVDDEIVSKPVGMLGRRLNGNFHIVIGKTVSASIIERCVERCGLKVNDIALEPLASAEAVLTEDEKEAGVALVDIGGGTTDLAIYHGGNVRHTAVVVFGGDNITADIRKGCDTLNKYAEELKVRYGSALVDVESTDTIISIPGINGREPKEVTKSKLAGIIQARILEIFTFVNFQIEMSGYGDKLGAGIVITGGGALLQDLTHFVRLNTGYDVRIGYPREWLCPESLENYNLPQYSTAIGLVKMALDGSLDAPCYPVEEVAKPEVDEVQSSTDRNKRIKPKSEGWKFKKAGGFSQFIGKLMGEDTDAEDLD